MRELEVYMKKPVPVESASALIDEKIKELGDWRGKTLAKVREIIHEADPEIVEEWKWVKPTNPGTPVWSHGGIVCTGETYKNVVKMTFAKGAALEDPSGLFNSSLDGNVRRAIDIHEGDKVDEAALKDLIRAAVALNLKGKSKPKPSKSQGHWILGYWRLWSGCAILRLFRTESIYISEPGWRNWQTQRTQNPPIARSWGFDSPSRHQLLRPVP